MGCLGPRDARDSPCQITLVTHDAMQGRTVDTVPSPKPSRVSSKAYALVRGAVAFSGGLAGLCNGTSFDVQHGARALPPDPSPDRKDSPSLSTNLRLVV